MYKENNSGLGISLEGTVDVEDGKEVRPHHYIRNILPDGPVGKNNMLQAGDELLEVLIRLKISFSYYSERLFNYFFKNLPIDVCPLSLIMS